MIDSLSSGKLIRDPTTKTGPSGKPYCNFLLTVFTGEESPVVVSGIAFQDVAQRIGKLAKGDALTVTGALKPSTWADKATGETKHGLNVTVSACLSAYDVKKKRTPPSTNGDNAKPHDYSPGFDEPLDF